MSKIIVSEGKTTSEAIEKGLKELNLHRDQVEIRVLEQEKRSFFDILAPRVVKVELTVKEKPQKEEKILTEEDLEETKNNVEKFIKEFLKNLGEEYKYEISIEKNEINVKIDGGNSGTLIGYRGETLNALQHILSLIANKHTSAKVRVLLNVDGYKEKREKTLKNFID